MFAQRLLLLCRYAIWLKNAQRFFYILNTLPNRKLSIRGRESCYSRPRVVLPSAASSATFSRESTTCQAFQEALSLCKERCDTHDGVSHLSFINRFVLAQSRYEVLLGLLHKLVRALSVGRCHLKEVGTVGQVSNRQCGALCVARNGVAQEGRTAEVVNHERSAGFQ